MAKIDVGAELLRRTIEIGETLVRIADDLGEDIAANHLVAGLEILKIRAQLGLELDERLFHQPEADSSQP